MKGVNAEDMDIVNMENKNEEERISFVMNGPSFFEKFLNLFTFVETEADQ